MGTAPLQDRRFWIFGGALLALILAAASWLLVINPELSDTTQLRSQKKVVDDQNFATSVQNAKLAQQSHNLSGLQSKLLRALHALPPDSGLPALTEDLNRLASATDVSLAGITVGAVAPVAAPAGAAPAPAPADSGSGSDTSNTPAAPAVPAATGQYSITVTVQSEGTLVHQLTFLKTVEKGRRLALVTSAQITESGGSRVASVDSDASMITQLTIYSAPMTADQIAQLKHLLPAGS